MQQIKEKKILFITTTNLAVNPRLVKELRLACGDGFICTVVQFRLGNWSDAMTDQLKLEFPFVTFRDLSALRRPFLPWLISSLLERLARILPVFFLRGALLAGAVDKRSWLILNTLNKLGQTYNWVIAHNPGAFYPAMVLSKRTGAKLGIDVEDYHPGESNEKNKQVFTLKMMKLTLPISSYCSYASPLIMKEVHKQVGNLSSSHFVVLNSFPKDEFQEPVTTDYTVLKLVWFSQNISSGRGLEMIIPIVDKNSSKIELHLIGSINSEFEKRYIKGMSGIFLYEPVPHKKLHAFLYQFDVGLAIEPGKDENNNLAISNKIIAYAQAGLYILASHTPGQDLFLNESGLQFLQMENTEASIVHAFDMLLQLKENGLINKPMQYSIGSEYCWENISHLLVKTWQA